MPTKGASERWESYRFVVSSLRENRTILVQQLTAETQASLPEGSTPPDIGAHIDMVIGTLDFHGEQMMASDQAYLDELGDDTVYREVRDKAGEDLAAKYRSQRDIYTGAFGKAQALKLGFESVVDRQPDRFCLQVRRVKENLESPDFELPPALGQGVVIEPVIFAADFEPEYTRMLTAQDDLLRERREADTKLIAKRAAMEAYDFWFRFGAGFAETAMRLVGMSEEADRVRPSQRRPGRRAEAAESDRREEETSGDDETPPETPAEMSQPEEEASTELSDPSSES